MGYVNEVDEDVYEANNFSKSLAVPIIGDGYPCVQVQTFSFHSTSPPACRYDRVRVRASCGFLANDDPGAQPTASEGALVGSA